MQFRYATPSDFEAIARLVPTEEELFLVYPKGRYPFSVQQVRSLEQNRKALTVVDKESEVIGFANLYDIEPGEYAFLSRSDKP